MPKDGLKRVEAFRVIEKQQNCARLLHPRVLTFERIYLCNHDCICESRAPQTKCDVTSHRQVICDMLHRHRASSDTTGQDMTGQTENKDITLFVLLTVFLIACRRSETLSTRLCKAPIRPLRLLFCAPESYLPYGQKRNVLYLSVVCVLLLLKRVYKDA